MSRRQGFFASSIRILGFVRKEISSVLRQPRLLMTLVVGPFLILLIFGLGFRDRPAPFRTVLVLSGEQAQLAADREELSEAFGGGIDLESTTTDVEAAEERLRAGEIDLLIVAPDDPLGSLDRGERADFRIIHGEVDPVLRSNIGLLARLSVDEINRRVVREVVAAAQDSSEAAEDPIAGLRETAALMVDALESGDRPAADDEIARARDELGATRERSGGDLYSSVARSLGMSEEEAYAGLEEDLAAASSEDDQEALDGARRLEQRLEDLDRALTRAQDIDPALLASPFGADVVELTDVPPQPAIFYAPGTLVLLIQHLALTFAALSLVRERELGLSEVFRVSPLSAGEALLGKYLGFGLIAAAVSTALTGAMIAFGVPIRGPLWLFAGVVTLLILASLGMGFVLSGLARSDSQAVQYAMMVLLVSIFFTGFVLPLDQLIPAAQTVSYLIPGTYGIDALHDVMFRSTRPDAMILGGLGLYTLVLALLAWWAVRREVSGTRA